MDPLGRAIRFYRDNFPALLLVSVAYAIPIFYALRFLAAAVANKAPANTIMLLSVLILVMTSFMQAGLIYFIYQRMRKSPVSIANAVIAGLVYVPKLLFLNLNRAFILVLVFFIALNILRGSLHNPAVANVFVFLIILLWFYIIIRTGLADFMVIVEQKMVLLSLKESYLATVRIWARLLSILAPVMMLLAALRSIIVLKAGTPIVVFTADVLLYAVSISFMLSLFLSYYWQLRNPEQ